MSIDEKIDKIIKPFSTYSEDEYGYSMNEDRVVLRDAIKRGILEEIENTVGQKRRDGYWTYLVIDIRKLLGEGG